MKRKIFNFGLAIGIIVGFVAMCISLGACAPMPTTRINLATGEYSSPKDIKADHIGIKETSPTGQVTKDISIEGLDSSGSQVMLAWAKAQEQVAKSNEQAFAAFGALAQTVAKFAGVPAPVVTPTPVVNP